MPRDELVGGVLRSNVSFTLLGSMSPGVDLINLAYAAEFVGFTPNLKQIFYILFSDIL